MGQGRVLWVGFFCRIPDFFGIRRFESRFRPADQGNHSQHKFDAFERLCKSSGVHPWHCFPAFVVHMMVGFWVVSGFRLMTGQPHLRLFARRQWLTVYSAHSGCDAAGPYTHTRLILPCLGPHTHTLYIAMFLAHTHTHLIVFCLGPHAHTLYIVMLLGHTHT